MPRAFLFRPSILGLGAVLLFAGTACRSEPRGNTPDVGDVLPLLPLPPGAGGVTRSGSEDALQLTIQSGETPDELLTYYRKLFAEEPWTLISDTKAPDGAFVLYAETNSRPIWVRIDRAKGAPGSRVQLSGALVAAEADTTAADSARP